MGNVWTLTPNPALDFTYRLPELTLGVPHRITDYAVRPGGKGLNVSRVLAQIGTASIATGFLGGSNGQRLGRLLNELEYSELIAQQFVRTEVETRMSIAVVDRDSRATVLNEAGETPSEQDWSALIGILRHSLTPGDILACCGSFAGDSDPRWMSRIVEAVHDAGARILVDATAGVLTQACDAGADLVKPNDLELKETTGYDSICDGARALLDRGVGAVIVSEGADGMSIHGTDGSYRARPQRFVEGNPTGAGDASVAAWCAYIAQTDPEPALTAADLSNGLPGAVALSGAAVACPVAGEINYPLYEEMKSQISVEENSCHS
ncbi:MAG: hexose kinase [Actinomycetaceae bacterium]|nr:hexose kinase [Actinomycetaceae bacterium]